MDAYRFSIAWSRIFPSKPSLKPAFMLYLALIQYQANKSLWSAVAVLKSEHFLECGWFKDGLAYIFYWLYNIYITVQDLATLF